jgi:hypothetical protein
MLQTKKIKLCILLLLIELLLIETRFIQFERPALKKQMPTQKFQIKINEMVTLFQFKPDKNELYSEDLLAFALLILEIIKKRNQSLTPAVYWYSRKG